METNYVQEKIRRSRLIMPANVRKFVESAYLRNADALVLDLEDSVPDSEKLATRELIKELIPVAARGGSDVYVRVNNTKELLEGDIKASVWPELAGIYLPMVETSAEVNAVEAIIAQLEEQRSIPCGHIKISVGVETVRGYLNVEEIAKATERVDAITLGDGDFSLDSGMELSETTANAWIIPRMGILFAARGYGKIPMLGSYTNFSDYSGLEKHAGNYYKHGYLGSSCIHPGHVEILNKMFSPNQLEAEYAKKVVEAFERGLSLGRASVALEGKMIDYVHYKKAKKIFDRMVRIEEIERKKQQARDRVIK